MRYVLGDLVEKYDLMYDWLMEIEAAGKAEEEE